MAVSLYNDHVFLPHRPNWKTDVQWSRAWETKVAAAVTGAESRTAMRAHPRRSLKWLVSVADLQEQALLDDRLRAALKSGRACTPFWGRGQAAALPFEDVVTVDEAWPWAVGDFLFTMNVHRAWEVRAIDDVTLSAPGVLELTLSSILDQQYPARTLVWPILYGELVSPDLAAVTSWHGEASLELREVAAPASAEVVGEYTPPDPDTDLAIPDQEIAVTNDVR